MNSSKRLEVIDFLRGISCIGVLLFHVRVELWVGIQEIIKNSDQYSTFTKGAAILAVPTPFLGYSILLFFLISGFCIHYPNVGQTSTPNWKTYFCRRFWRIYPPFFFASLLSAFLSYFCYVYWNDPTWNLSSHWRIAALLQNYPPNNGQYLPNPSLWTIPLEIEFYILYPLAYFLICQRKGSLLFLFSISISIASIFFHNKGYHWINFTSFFLWPSWLLGTWVAVIFKNKKIAQMKNFTILMFLVLSLITAVISWFLKWPFWANYTAWTTFYLTLFIFSLTKFEWIKKQLGERFISAFSWIGKISFSLYLIHYPIFKVLGYWHRDLFDDKPSNFLITLLYLLPVIFFGWCFYMIIEKPIHQWSKRSHSI